MEPHPHDEAADLIFREWLEGNSSGSVSSETELLQSLFFYFRNRYKSLIMPFCLRAEQYIGSEGLLDPRTYTDAASARYLKYKAILGIPEKLKKQNDIRVACLSAFRLS